MSVALERYGRVLVVRMRRQHKRNAIDAEMTAGLDQALNLLDDDEDLWAGVLTGDGGVFSAGTDLATGSGEPTARGGYYGSVRRRRSTPVIAAVEGIAFGGGFELVLACDLVVAARTATFGLPEVARGVIATSGALFRAPRGLPLNVARAMLLTGEPLTAERAWSLGLVNELADEGAALDVALDLARRVCANSPTSVRSTLQALQKIVDADDQAGWEATTAGMQRIADSEDLREGMSAFFGRRPPKWTGR
jgi:enoyl-CoA hydratase/carnithine racemase